jgi:hypothetical protein
VVGGGDEAPAAQAAGASLFLEQSVKLRARLKPGVRTVILGGISLAPEYPTYWNVPADDSAAVELLVESGQAEYEPEFARAPGGEFTSPALQQVQVAQRPAPQGKNKFSRTPHGGGKA